MMMVVVGVVVVVVVLFEAQVRQRLRHSKVDTVFVKTNVREQCSPESELSFLPAPYRS